MKFSTVVLDSTERFGLVEGDLIHLAPAGETLKGAIAEGLEAAGARLKTAPAVPLAVVGFAPVVPDPAHVFCVGLNYRAHRDETRPANRKSYPEFPIIFTRFASSLSGHGQPIVKPHNSAVVDWEGELAVVIGKGGRHIPEDEAMAHIAGVTCFNDVSMRDWQMRGEQWAPGKNFPASGPMGPWLVTLDETGPLDDLELCTFVDGELMQQTTLDLLVFGIPALIAYCSGFCELLPGDVIVTGTPGGVGFTRNPPILLEPGKTVDVEIGGVGRLRNPVVAE